jgi:hypothetical protein
LITFLEDSGGEENQSSKSDSLKILNLLNQKGPYQTNEIACTLATEFC